MNSARFACMQFGQIFLSRCCSPAVHCHKAKISEFDPELQGYACALFSLCERLLCLKKMGFLYRKIKTEKIPLGFNVFKYGVNKGNGKSNCKTKHHDVNLC